MNKKRKSMFSMLIGTSLVAMAALSILSTTTVIAADPATELQTSIEEGKKIAFSRPKGNCLACHMIKDGASPGTIAPPLIAMKSRFPDKQVLKEQIWDASKRNPETSMPLFGRYEILTESELDQVIDFIYSL